MSNVIRPLSDADVELMRGMAESRVLAKMRDMLRQANENQWTLLQLHNQAENRCNFGDDAESGLAEFLDQRVGPPSFTEIDV